MRILLINPNRYRTPPVQPVGLEYLQSVLGGTRHESRILDLCFADEPGAALEGELERFQPQVAGLTVRNIDTAIYCNNVFFLDEIKSLVGLLKSRGIPSILGGAGFSFCPGGVLEYLGADWGVSGPGEAALPRLLAAIEINPPAPGTVVDGWADGLDPDLEIRGRGGQVDYRAYRDGGGIIGFETQKGCYENCPYCQEGSGRVFFRNPLSVVAELKEIVGRGFEKFHLCDTEFNQDLSYCREFLETLIAKGPALDWVLYLKSAPYSEELFRLLSKSGARLITLSLPTGRDSLAHAAEIRRLCSEHGIRLAVDYLCGFPGQSLESVGRDIETLRRIRPDTVGLNSVLRLYPEMATTREVVSSAEHRGKISGELKDNPWYLRPVFYINISPENLREIIGDDPLFKIEGFERTSNYERL